MSGYNLSSLNFGIEVTPNNRSIDFKTSGGGPEKQATLRVGLYSVSSLKTEVQRAMAAADPANTYTVTINRTVSAGTQNRITLATSGAFLSLLFATGTRTGSNAGSLLGYGAMDKTGATSYVSTNSVGTILLPSYPPQDFQPLGTIYDSKSSINDSTSGKIETVSFTSFRNFEFRFRWIEYGSSEFAGFQSFAQWILRGGPVEFVSDRADVSTLAVGVPINVRRPFELNRMVPNFYDYFETPVMTFREQS